MPILVIPANAVARLVDDFPKGCKRSRKGPIPIKPATTVSVTDQELAHLRGAHADVMEPVIVAQPKSVADYQKRKRPAKPAEDTKPAADDAAKPAAAKPVPAAKSRRPRKAGGR